MVEIDLLCKRFGLVFDENRNNHDNFAFYFSINADEIFSALKKKCSKSRDHKNTDSCKVTNFLVTHEHGFQFVFDRTRIFFNRSRVRIFLN